MRCKSCDKRMSIERATKRLPNGKFEDMCGQCVGIAYDEFHEHEYTHGTTTGDEVYILLNKLSDEIA